MLHMSADTDRSCWHLASTRGVTVASKECFQKQATIPALSRVPSLANYLTMTAPSGELKPGSREFCGDLGVHNMKQLVAGSPRSHIRASMNPSGNIGTRISRGTWQWSWAPGFERKGASAWSEVSLVGINIVLPHDLVDRMMEPNVDELIQ